MGICGRTGENGEPVLSFLATTDVPDSIPGRVEFPQKLQYALATLHTA